MELTVGGIYLIKRKPISKVKLYDCKGEHHREFYKKNMECKVLAIQGNINRKREKYIVYYFGLDTVDFLYTQWLERNDLRKVVRDLSDWPERARHHFLMLKGASTAAAMEGTLEEARHSIARTARSNRLYKERMEKEKKEKKDSLTLCDTVGGNTYVHHATATAVSTADGDVYVPQYGTLKAQHPCEIEVEFEDPPDDGEWVIDPPPSPTPKKAVKKNRKKKKPRAKKLSKKFYTPPPVTFTHNEEGLPTISKETLEKVKAEVNKATKKDKEEMLAKLYGKAPGYVGYSPFTNKEGKAKKKQTLPDELPKWAKKVAKDLEEEEME